MLKSGEVLGVLDEPPTEPDVYFGAGDFNVGMDVTIYGRTYKVLFFVVNHLSLCLSLSLSSRRLYL